MIAKFTQPMELMSDTERQRAVIEVLRLLKPHRVQNHNKIRVGSAQDGGYVMLDDFEGVNCAFSFGIFNDDNWDKTMAEQGIRVLQFDNSIDRAPTTHSLLEFHKKTVSAQRSDDAITLEDLVASHGIAGRQNLILKMDIEDSEWDVFDQTDANYLCSFKQILCEFHSMHRLGDPAFYPRARRVFEKITANFKVIHVHGNNYAPCSHVYNISLPWTMEFAFANTTAYDLVESNETFPNGLDAPNNPGALDYILGNFTF